MATTSKEGSRRVNYSVPTRRGSDDKYQYPFVRGAILVLGNWNDCTIKECKSNNWRASLVPAAAVIPAPRVYTKAVAVKKLVVNFGDVKANLPRQTRPTRVPSGTQKRVTSHVRLCKLLHLTMRKGLVLMQGLL